METNSIYDKYAKIISISKKINSNRFDDLLRIFGKSIINVVGFNSNIGTIAHICVYLRNIGFLKQVVDKFDDPKRLVQWLSERDENGSTAVDLVGRFEFQEIYIYLNNIITGNGARNKLCILKEGVLEKYTNLINGYKERYVILTPDSLFYGKKKSPGLMTELKIGSVHLEHQQNMKKFKLTTKVDDLEFVFKNPSHEDVSDWIGLLQNLIASRDREFYFNNFVFKIISDVAKEKDRGLHALLKTAGIFPFYTEGDLKPADLNAVKDDERELHSHAESSPMEDLISRELNVSERLKMQNCGERASDREKEECKDIQDDLVLFSLESENDEENYEFFEARDENR